VRGEAEGLGLLSLEQSARGGLSGGSQYLQGGGKGDGARLFSGVPSDGARGNGHEQKHAQLCRNVRKRFAVRVSPPWSGLPREAEKSPFLQIRKSHLGTVLGSQLWVALLEQGVGLGDLQRALPTAASL